MSSARRLLRYIADDLEPGAYVGHFATTTVVGTGDTVFGVIDGVLDAGHTGSTDISEALTFKPRAAARWATSPIDLHGSSSWWSCRS